MSKSLFFAAFLGLVLLSTVSGQDEKKNACDDGYQCEIYQTCCRFGDGNFGCCPYAYANCCVGVNACCQSGFTCQPNGTGCVRKDL